MKHPLAVLVVIALIANFVSAQPPSTLWSNDYDHNDHADWFNHVQQTTDGGFIAVGTTMIPPFALEKLVYAVKTDSNGDTLWTKTYGNVRYYGGAAVRQIEGGYIITGSGSVSSQDFDDVILIKTDNDGNMEWLRSYGGQYNDAGGDVIEAPDNGFLVVGYEDVNSLNNENLYVIRTNANGDTLWTRTYGYGVGKEIITTSDGYYVIIGENVSQSPYVIRLLKINASGDTLWTQTYSNGFSVASSFQQTNDDGYIILGQRSATGGGDYWPWLIKTAANGDTLWTKLYNWPGFHLAGGTEELRQTTDGGYVFVGYQNTIYLPPSLRIIKTDANGDTLWTGVYGGDTGATGSSIIEIAENNFIVAGKHPSGDISDGYLLRLGESPQSVTPQKATIVTFFTCAISPNPFNATTAISYQLPVTANVNLTIYDISGRQVIQLVNGWREAGDHEVTFDGVSLPSGIYLAKLTAGKYQASQKMVLLK